MNAQHQLHVNGQSHTLAVDSARPLLDVLRDEMGLTGPKYGCGEGKCGACTVHLDGKPVQACSISVGEVGNSPITTIEGLAPAGRLHPLQAAFLDAGALQCGYCTPGMVMSAAALLAETPRPDRSAILHALHDNICRCGTYQRIVTAIQQAAALLADGVESVELPQGMGAGSGVSQPIPIVDTSETVPDKSDEGIFVAYPCPELAVALYGEDVQPPPPQERALSEIGPWLHVDSDGAVTVAVGKAEVGQNIRTSLALIVAEELDIAPERVRVVLGDTALTPYDRGTFGSRTTPVTGPQLWRTGATARELLLELAAANWRVEKSELSLADGAVRHPASGRTATLGELARDRNLLRIADPEQAITPPSRWKRAGHSPAKVNGPDFVTGRHRFASDVILPGALFGKVLRPPAYGATLLEIDTREAEALPGVTVVRDGDFVGAVAPSAWLAEQAITALRVRWKQTLQVSRPELFDFLQASPVEEEAGRHRPYLAVEGDAGAALATAHLTLSRRFTVDYIAHAPLEPRAALAHWQEDGRLTVWTGTSRPFGVRTELALAFALPETQIRVVVPDTGSGYGGKHTGQAAIEAARLARSVGRPVKVIWSREEEFTWAYLRPGGLIEVEAGVNSQGHLLALALHNYNSGAAGIEALYEIPARHIAFTPCESPLPQGSYRSLAAPANHFARETVMDEFAHALTIDPLELRLRNLKHTRMRAVLESAAQAFGWGTQTPKPHHGYGLAGGADKDSYVATCAEVYVEPETGRVQVVRVVTAYDCGAIINPDTVRNQVEGALVQGLGGALFERIDFANGKLLNGNFADYRVPRFGDMPEIEVVLMDRREIPPAGAGETPLVAIAPAIGNAIFQATGVRLRGMPLTPDGVVPLPAR